MKTESKHGVYTIKLPLYNGEEIQLTGTCMDQITQEFPMYPIEGKVDNDIKEAYKKIGGDPRILPKLPKQCGGAVDFMVGISYNRYCPDTVQRCSG